MAAIGDYPLNYVNPISFPTPSPCQTCHRCPTCGSYGPYRAPYTWTSTGTTYQLPNTTASPPSMPNTTWTAKGPMTGGFDAGGTLTTHDPNPSRTAKAGSITFQSSATASTVPSSFIHKGVGPDGTPMNACAEDCSHDD